MAWGIDDGVVPRGSEKLLGGAGDGHTTLTLLLLPIHVECKGERRFAETVGLFLELLQLTLGDATKLENQATSGGRLARVDMAADDDGQMLLAVGCHCGVYGGGGESERWDVWQCTACSRRARGAVCWGV